MSHWVGFGFQAPSRPLLIVSPPLPLPKLLFQPRPCSSMGAASGSGPTWVAAPAPWHLPKRVPAGDERDGLFVVHRHAREGLANVTAGGDRVRVAVRPFRVHVDQAHLHGGEGILEVPVAGVALVAEPLVLGAPVDVLFRLPDVLAPAAEAEGLEPHRLQRAVAGEDHQVGPGDLAAVLLLDRPEQTARLVEVHVVRPAVERREALGAGPARRRGRRPCGRCRRCATPSG